MSMHNSLNSSIKRGNEPPGPPPPSRPTFGFFNPRIYERIGSGVPKSQRMLADRMKKYTVGERPVRQQSASESHAHPGPRSVIKVSNGPSPRTSAPAKDEDSSSTCSSTDDEERQMINERNRVFREQGMAERIHRDLSAITSIDNLSSVSQPRPVLKRVRNTKHELTSNGNVGGQITRMADRDLSHHAHYLKFKKSVTSPSAQRPKTKKPSTSAPPPCESSSSSSDDDQQLRRRIKTEHVPHSSSNEHELKHISAPPADCKPITKKPNQERGIQQFSDPDAIDLLADHEARAILEYERTKQQLNAAKNNLISKPVSLCSPDSTTDIDLSANKKPIQDKHLFNLKSLWRLSSKELTLRDQLRQMDGRENDLNKEIDLIKQNKLAVVAKLEAIGSRKEVLLTSCDQSF